jgi:RNA polymerase sigma-B factor
VSYTQVIENLPSVDPTYGAESSRENNSLRSFDDQQVMRLFSSLRNSNDPRRRKEVRNQIIEMYQPLAYSLARRYRNRGERLEDLCQVAMIGLISAVDGFDENKGNSLASYAYPTILGEIRRHFRDKSWNVRVPRRLQELRSDIAITTETLHQKLGYQPSHADLAKELNISEADIKEGIAAAQAYSAASLEAPAYRDGDSATVGESIPAEETGYGVVEAREMLRSLVKILPDRERKILGLRFFHQLTQTEIAAEVGISQMHVSRLINDSIEILRDNLKVAA